MKIERAKIIVRGAVQGVGFRPFIFRLATELNLRGIVLNSSQGVFIEIEGERNLLNQFLLRLEKEKPPRAIIQSLEFSFLDTIGYENFEILASENSGAKTALILPDIATCPDCLREIFDPQNRRYLYPFTNCTNCGPRFSIIESLPYDRANTSMRNFEMCADCEKEFYDPRDRRFHAQPNACPNCGPQLQLLRSGVRQNAANSDEIQPRSAERSHDALLRAANAIRDGKILALKGIGGFQLLVDARNENAIRRLRERKHREEKPFATMFPSLDAVKEICVVNEFEERLLQSPEAPIVLLEKKSAIGNRQSAISNSVAPKNPYLGVMLPYSPLHHILLRELNFPVVATSGNLSGEPICIDENDALSRLGDIADLFLVHNRPIVRQLDDSVVRIIFGREQILRRARGYAPLPIKLNFQLSTFNHQPILAVGAHLKNSVALAVGEQIFLSQHIGDLETEPAFSAFKKVAADFENLYEQKPGMVACDLHPEYLSTKFAEKLGSAPASGAADDAFVIGTNGERRPIFCESVARNVRREGAPNGSRGGCAPQQIRVQHHYAHVLSCAAENEIEAPLLGVAWDGTGLGTDGKIWGGEFLYLKQNSGGEAPRRPELKKLGLTEFDPPIEFERVAHFREFPLPGGETAIKQPRRSALGLLWEIFGDELFERGDFPFLENFSDAELSMIRKMLAQKINSPLTSSVGRLFDAVAALIGLRQRVSFEGQAAMELEFAIEKKQTDETYAFEITAREDARLTNKIAATLGNVYPTDSSLATRHSSLLIDWQPMILKIFDDLKSQTSIGIISAKFHNTLVEIIIHVAKKIGEPKVALSGGCFQNKYLLERAILKLQAADFKPYWHQRVPTNDGGIALGQVIAAIRQFQKGEKFNFDEIGLPKISNENLAIA
jgi:hydrogenase maturation protein HypF